VQQTTELAAGMEDCDHRFIWVMLILSLDDYNCSLGKRHTNIDEVNYP
jgi:hypothetical protein